MNRCLISLSLKALFLLIVMSGVSEAGDYDFFDFGEFSGYGHAAKIIINARNIKIFNNIAVLFSGGGFEKIPPTNNII